MFTNSVKLFDNICRVYISWILYEVARGDYKLAEMISQKPSIAILSVRHPMHCVRKVFGNLAKRM